MFLNSPFNLKFKMKKLIYQSLVITLLVFVCNSVYCQMCFTFNKDIAKPFGTQALKGGNCYI